MKNKGCHLPHRGDCPSPYFLWVQAGEDKITYLELMRVHGHVVRRYEEGDGPIAPKVRRIK